jgi:isocitrate/isopropylmalate dehydrogenase
MADYRIAVIPGDGVGAEVVGEGPKVLSTVAGKFGINWDLRSTRGAPTTTSNTAA